MSKKNKKKIEDYDDIFEEEEEEELPIIKKKVCEPSISQQMALQSIKQQDQANSIRCPIEQMNVEMVLQDILYESSKESNFSKTLKQILSNGQRELKDRLKYYQFKWQSLGHANIGRQEYQKQESLLREQQGKDIAEIQNNVISNLGGKGVPGFQQKDEILNEFRINFMKKRHLNPDGPYLEEFQFYVDQEEAGRLKRDQLTLLEKLLSEQHLISETPPEMRRFPDRNQRIAQPQEGPDLQRLQLGNKIQMDKIIKEKLSNMTSKRIEELLRLEQTEFAVIPRNVRVMLLDSKSDELYTDKDFQQDQADKYVDVFNELKNQHFHNLDLDSMLELTIYIVNNMHYQQKFSLPQERKQVTARDLLNYIEKIQKQQ